MRADGDQTTDGDQAADGDQTPDGYAAVIVSYRRYDLLRACVLALQASSVPPSWIVVVDNASDPIALGAAVDGLAGVQVIANSGNAGYARACNQGWRATMAPNVLFLNPDVTVGTNTLERCLEALDGDPAIGIVTARLLREDGSLDHACHRGLPTPGAGLAYALRLDRLAPGSHRLGRYRMSWEDVTTDHDVEACSGAFMLVRRSVLEAIGGWDERYWFYGEDLDLCVRTTASGSRVRYLGSTAATHIKGASSRLRAPSSELSPQELAHRRRLQGAIVASHRLFFRDHLAATTNPVTRALVEAMFRLQGARLRDRIGWSERRR